MNIDFKELISEFGNNLRLNSILENWVDWVLHPKWFFSYKSMMPNSRFFKNYGFIKTLKSYSLPEYTKCNDFTLLLAVYEICNEIGAPQYMLGQWVEELKLETII